ncbi:MAG: hypothetical protein FJ388_00795 [Verrucomicrobia bacterium]|nr:hypothetical protein [Verrucomicrobiota bacterium]
MQIQTIRLIGTAIMLCALGDVAYSAVKPTTKKTKFPPIWEAAGPQKRLEAIRVADVDAMRLLVERVCGVQLTSDTTIHDLLLASDDIASEVERTIRGVSTTEEPKYLKDGSLQVVRAVKLREVLDVLTAKLKTKTSETGVITQEELLKFERKHQDTVVDVMGNGALPDSEGLKKIQAKRAAEIDAYRKLLERLMGVQITSQTSVKKCVLESDFIGARAAEWVKGAKPVKIEYERDGSCEVSMQIKFTEIFRVIKKYTKTGVDAQDWVKIETEYADKTFTEIGRGAPRPVGYKPGAAEMAAWPTSVDQALGKPFNETRIIIRELVGQKVVIE